MPAAKKSTGTPGPKTSPRAAASAPPRPTLHSISAGEVAFGFVAMHWIFVGFIVLVIEIVGIPWVFFTSSPQNFAAVIGALILSAGFFIALLLVIWLIKGCAEPRWYRVAICVLLQLCLAIYIYPTSRWFSALTCVSLAATAFGMLKRPRVQPGKLRAA